MSSLSGLECKLHYVFEDPLLLALALTHRSAAKRNNERLEFLGDSILGMIVSEYLYLQIPSASEGELSRMRSLVVRKESLVEIAGLMDLSVHLELGHGEIKSGTQTRGSILADTVEALIGAIYIDGGFASARDCVLSWFSEIIQKAIIAKSIKDSKTTLQEWLQGKGEPLPNYKLMKTVGPPHDRQFTVSCRIAGIDRNVEATATNRRKAEQLVAEQMLMELKSGS